RGHRRAAAYIRPQWSLSRADITAHADLSARRRTFEGVRPVSELTRTVNPFKVVSDWQPSGDQPAAIDELERRIRAGEQDVVLLGATGTGKSATTAWLVERLQRPTLVMAPNKTLAAQL